MYNRKNLSSHDGVECWDGRTIGEVPEISHNPLRPLTFGPWEGMGAERAFGPQWRAEEGRKGKGNGPSARGEGGAGLWPVEVLRLISGHGH